jgi:hypothetical protein
MQLIQRRVKEANLWGDGSRFKVNPAPQTFNLEP